MLASRTIISACGRLTAATRLLKRSHHFLFVNLSQGFSQPVGGSPEFSEIGRFDLRAGRWHENTESFAAARHSYGRIGLQKMRNLFPEFTDSNFDWGHRSSPCVQ
jgi:hypothetical protein